MPTPIQETLKIILSADSKLREIKPILYALPKDEHMPKGWTNLKRMRYLDHDLSAGRNIKRWLWRDYSPELVLQEPPFDKHEDQSEIFTGIRHPLERWWSGIRDFMYFLPYYSWWENEQIMTQWPHFHRATLRLHDVMEQVKPQHLIKIDQDIDQRLCNFARKHNLLYYGNLPHERHIRHRRPDIMKMEKQGEKQLKQWLLKNPTWQKKLDDYLEPDWQYWDKVEGQE